MEINGAADSSDASNTTHDNWDCAWVYQGKKADEACWLVN